MIHSEIERYTQRHILPKYIHFDKGHGPGHVAKVIANSLSIAADYDVDIDKVYVVAAYHDIGLSQGRAHHEKASSAFLLADTTLRMWFSADELRLMAEAVEDHRASNDYEPRSIYGKIVSEADRDIEYTTILTRTVQYGLTHYPEYDFEQHVSRAYEHIQNKYGEGGYLRLWLNTETNRRNLQAIRATLASRDTFRADFEKIFAECIR